MLRVLSLNCAHAPHEVNVNDLCLSSSATLSSPTVTECPDQPSPTPTEVPPTQPSPDTVLFNIQSQSDSLLRVPTRIVYGSRTSRPLSALVDIGFTGHVLVSTKIATELGRASPAPSQCIRLADGSVVTSALGFTNATLTVGSKHHCLRETTPLIRVFPLQSYDMILGKAWLDAHGTLIDCPSNTVTLRGTNSALVVHGCAACNIDLACTTEALHDNPGLLTCNQFQCFLREHDVETVAAFLIADNTPESLAHATLVNDLAETQQLHATTRSLDALRQKFEADS
jgi:hypothetical protein